MRLIFLGGAREIGRSGVIVEMGKWLLLDYGIKLYERTSFPLPFHGMVDGVVLSHAHLDHSGFVPEVYELAAVPCFLTYPTHALSALLVKDAMEVGKKKRQKLPFGKRSLKRMSDNCVPLPYGSEFMFKRGSSLRLVDAGHIPGSAMIEVENEGKKLLYTGDFNTNDTRMHEGVSYSEKLDVLVIESTYSDRDHMERKEVEKAMCDEVLSVLEAGGSVLFPCFAVGRSQELLQVLNEFIEGYPVYLDGMAKSASAIIADYPSYVRDFDWLLESLNGARWVAGEKDRRKALSSPSIIVATAGMLEGGPALNYVLRLDEKSGIIFTGYQIPGTNARRLLDGESIKMNGAEYMVKGKASYFDLSAHAGRSGLVEFVERTNPEKVFCMHGDHCAEFAGELCEIGFDAYAPSNGEVCNVE